ncbi:MAG TPA: hypothetical protein VFY10_04600 [Dehalococcoidia bacterium]|jgi:hypothetical protein|nr:hypothetical protein [Dehalococcoidia bacterium]
MLHSPGLRLSFAGGIVVILGMLGLIVLPTLVAAPAMLIGALAVGAGFIWTLIEFYMPQPGPPDDG